MDSIKAIMTARNKLEGDLSVKINESLAEFNKLTGGNVTIDSLDASIMTLNEVNGSIEQLVIVHAKLNFNGVKS